MNHSDLTLERWGRFTLAQQILQVAAEMHRARAALESGDGRSLAACYERALRLTDLTSQQARIPGRLRRELRRWRTCLAELYAAREPDPVGHARALCVLLDLNAETHPHRAALGLG